MWFLILAVVLYYLICLMLDYLVILIIDLFNYLNILKLSFLLPNYLRLF